MAIDSISVWIGDKFSSLWCYAVNYSRRVAINYFFPYIKQWSIRTYGKMNSLRVIRLTKHTVFKPAFLRAHEAETMRFVSQNTTIPVPKVIDHWPLSQDKEGIIMEYIQGRPLQTVWPSLNDDQKTHLAEQIQGYMSQLRSLTQPKDFSGRICSLNGGACFDPLLLGKFCGPFNSEQELNEFCLSRFAFLTWDASTHAQVDAIRDKLVANHHIVFTHSDFIPRNILVDDQNNIISVLDWEMAGWKPEQWEYVKATWMADPDEGWPAFMGRILPGYQDQLDLHIEMCIIHSAPF